MITDVSQRWRGGRASYRPKGEPLDIEHGWGREVLGYVVVWCDAPVALSALPSADPKRVLRLLPSATCRLRLVLLT
jgi:hypothetical protein